MRLIHNLHFTVSSTENIMCNKSWEVVGNKVSNIEIEAGKLITSMCVIED